MRQRIKLAGLSDPMLAVTTSDIQPLPHQLRAVYGELLPRTPLRFLLADDPGAGKTIMAGLYIKELILREDVRRCLIVAPGGLVDQWQDELFLKFGLAFEILTPQFTETVFGASASEQHPRLIARMDRLARNEDLQAQLAKSEWDLVVVDEAHRMGAHDFGGKLEKTKRFQLGEQLGDIARHLLLMTATPHSGKETTSSRASRAVRRAEGLGEDGASEPDPASGPGPGPGPDGDPAPGKTRFFGSKQLLADRYASDFEKLVDEILAPLGATPGASLTVTVEIEATTPEGFDDAKVRTVSENATTLKFEASGFEDV